MRHTLVTTALVATLATPSLALAQDAGPDATPSATEVVTDVVDQLEGPVSNKKLLAELRDIKEKYERLQNRETEGLSLWIGLAALLGAALKFLFDGLKRVSGMTSRGKRWIPWIMIALAPLSGFFTHAATGATITQSIIVGGGATLAVLFNELGKTLRRK